MHTCRVWEKSLLDLLTDCVLLLSIHLSALSPSAFFDEKFAKPLIYADLSPQTVAAAAAVV